MMFTLTAAKLLIVSSRFLVFQVQMVLMNELTHG